MVNKQRAWKRIGQSFVVFSLFFTSCQPGLKNAIEPLEEPFAVPTEPVPTILSTEKNPELTPGSLDTPVAIPLVNGYLTDAELSSREAKRDSLDPLQWSSWPIVPAFNPYLIQVFQRGLAQGKGAARFSVLGDCQSLPNVFMGMFDTREVSFSEEDGGLYETIEYYQGSFSHQSLTVIDGLSPPTALSALWSDPEVCKSNESPLVCELRVNQPSLLWINLGSNWKMDASLTSYEKYMRQIIETTLSEGVIPVLSTKADNVEGGHRINALTAQLASEYQIPMWNFWRTADKLENHGLDDNRDNIYLTTEAWGARSFTALRVLDALHRFLMAGTE